MKKYIILILMLISIKIYNINFMIEEINISKYISYFAGNLYFDEVISSNTDIEVKDYFISNDEILIIPINREVRLPISGIVSEVGVNYIIIENSNSKYKINKINSEYRLYQYYHEGTLLGYSDKYHIISDDYLIVGNYIINYEKV